MKKISIHTKVKNVLADTITPVSIYLKARDVFPNTILLESSDYRGSENSFSFICMNPISTFMVNEGKLTVEFLGETKVEEKINSPAHFSLKMNEYVKSFHFLEGDEAPINGLFGYSEYDAVQYFETIKFQHKKKESYKIPEVRYSFYK